MQISDVCCRNALTGFRPGWQHLKAATPSTFAVNSDAEPPAKVDRFDYAADNSEDDTKEASSMTIRKATKVDPSLEKVRSTEFYPN